MEICLVNMPLAPVKAPSIALGLIQAILQRDCIESKTFYANLWFLEFIGPIEYANLNIARTSDCLIDWLFAGVVFPDFESDYNQYLQQMMDRNFNLGFRDREELKARLLGIREKVPDFINRTATKIINSSFAPLNKGLRLTIIFYVYCFEVVKGS